MLRSSLRGSLRWRLTAGIAAVLIVSVGISFAIIYRETSTRLQNQITQDVSADVDGLAASLRLIEDPTRAGVLAGAKRYVAGQPFASNATLLFVLVAGSAPVSNYPELLNSAAKPDDGESESEQAAENRLAAALARPAPGVSTQRASDVGSLRLDERTITVGSTRLTVGAGEPLRSVIRAQHGVVHSFLIAGIFIGVAVLLGAFLVGALVTAPLGRMAAVAARVDSGDLRPRMEIESNDEVGVLAAAFNHMLARLDDAFAKQKEFVADASHELRTPLTVIQGQLEVLAHRTNPSQDEIHRVERLVIREVQRMRRVVDDLMLLAQSERSDFLQQDDIDLPRFLGQLLDGATLIADRRFTLGHIPPIRLRADPDRLAQAIRNLITNAIDHTAPVTGEIRLEAAAVSDDRVVICVVDDGPGIPADQLDRIFERFHRTGTERAAEFGGAGLGLAIVRTIAEAHGGSASAANNATGSGARFELTVPGIRMTHLQSSMPSG
jgi:two-component system, OmpR family, sensor kinase